MPGRDCRYCSISPSVSRHVPYAVDPPMGSRCSRIAIPAISHGAVATPVGCFVPGSPGWNFRSPVHQWLCASRRPGREQTTDRARRPSPLSMNLIDWAGVPAAVETPRTPVPAPRTRRATTRGDIGASPEPPTRLEIRVRSLAWDLAFGRGWGSGAWSLGFEVARAWMNVDQSLSPRVRRRRMAQSPPNTVSADTPIAPALAWRIRRGNVSVTRRWGCARRDWVVIRRSG